MEKAIAKARALIEAMEYIRLFRGQIVVVKLGGSILDDLDLQRKLLTDIVFMSTVGIRPIIVHGGGKAISRAMNEAGLETQWVNGRRYTDERTLSIVEHTLVRTVNDVMCDTISQLGAKAMGIHSLSSCVLSAEQIHMTGENGRKLDLGFVGEVVEVNFELLKNICSAGTIPIIAPVALDKRGGKLNVNADSAAGMVAAEVTAEKFVVVSDTHGIRRDVNDPKTRISSANEREIREMVKQGIITEGMMPKVESCITSLKGGVKKAHIIDGRLEHSLLLEIYTDQGVGTQIVK